MTRPSGCLLAGVALALAAPDAALAGKVVLSPLLPDATIDAKQRLAVHQLMSSELEFAPEIDGVVDLSNPPPTLNDACLASAKCLQGIAASNGGEQVIAGKLAGAGSNFVVDLVYFDGKVIARRKAFTVPQDPTGLANAMTPIVRELLSGAGGAPAASATASSSNFNLDDEEDLGARPVAPPVPVAMAQDEMLTDDPPASSRGSSSRGGSDRRVAAASAATGLAVGALGAAGSATPPAGGVGGAPTPDDEALARSLTFGGSVKDISAEDLNAISFRPPPGVESVAPAPAPAPRPAPSRPNSRDLAFEEEELEGLEDEDAAASIDFDEKPGRGPRPTGPRGSTGPKPGGSNGGNRDHIMQITARGGYSKYYRFNFVTGGGEVAVAVVEGLHLLAGMEAYAVQRVLPPEVQLETGVYSQWNYIFPGNIGALYKFQLGLAQPYVGADTIFVQYYKDAIGADWAIGARARAGVDLMVIENFGFNINLAAGAWSGQNWSLIEQGVGRTGFLPQVSAGTVLSF